jgi:hypothetical protein
MMNLFEMMMQAQGGNAVNNMARQFGLAPEQAQSAMEALLPAFSTGLQQQAATPTGMESLLQMFGGGQHAAFHDADGDGIPDEAETQGNDILGQLFGGKEVSRAVAAQASAMSGVSDSIMKQMLPVMASMLMGGLFKGAMNNGLGGLLGQAMQGGLGNMMSGMMPGAQPQQQAGGGLFGGMLGNLLGGMMGGGQPQPQPQPQDPMMAGLDMLKGMFNTGQQVQQTQMDAFQQIFQQFGGRR